MIWLRTAPIPTTVVIAPSVRLNRPVPRVRSAIRSTDTTPKIPAPMPSMTWIAMSGETGRTVIRGAICYQIATKNMASRFGLNRAGICRFIIIFEHDLQY